MKLKSEKLLLLLPIVVIANSMALYLWIKLGWTVPTLIATLFGIGTILSFVLINRFYEYLQDNRYFIIGSAIFVFMVGMYLWRGKGIPYIGISFALLGMCLLFMVVLKGLWRNICCIAALVLCGIVFIFGDKEVNQAPTPAIEEVGVIKPGSAAAVSRDMADMMHRIFPSEQLEDPAVQEIIEVIASDSFQKKLKQHNPKTMDEYIHFIVSHGFTDLSEADFHKVLDAGYQVAEADYKKDLQHSC